MHERDFTQAHTVEKSIPFITRSIVSVVAERLSCESSNKKTINKAKPKQTMIAGSRVIQIHTDTE